MIAEFDQLKMVKFNQKLKMRCAAKPPPVSLSFYVCEDGFFLGNN